MRNHSLHVFDVFLLSMIMLKIDPLTLELLSNVDLKWNFRECVTRVSPRLHQPVSNRSDRQINDRNNGACSHNTLLDSAAGLFGTTHFRHGVDATKVPLKQDTAVATQSGLFCPCSCKDQMNKLVGMTPFLHSLLNLRPAIICWDSHEWCSLLPTETPNEMEK